MTSFGDHDNCEHSGPFSILSNWMGFKFLPCFLPFLVPFQATSTSLPPHTGNDEKLFSKLLKLKFPEMIQEKVRGIISQKATEKKLSFERLPSFLHFENTFSFI